MPDAVDSIQVALSFLLDIRVLAASRWRQRSAARLCGCYRPLSYVLSHLCVTPALVTFISHIFIYSSNALAAALYYIPYGAGLPPACFLRLTSTDLTCGPLWRQDIAVSQDNASQSPPSRRVNSRKR